MEEPIDAEAASLLDLVEVVERYGPSHVEGNRLVGRPDRSAHCRGFKVLQGREHEVNMRRHSGAWSSAAHRKERQASMRREKRRFRAQRIGGGKGRTCCSQMAVVVILQRMAAAQEQPST